MFSLILCVCDPASTIGKVLECKICRQGVLGLHPQGGSEHSWVFSFRSAFIHASRPRWWRNVAVPSTASLCLRQPITATTSSTPTGVSGPTSRLAHPRQGTSLASNRLPGPDCPLPERVLKALSITKPGLDCTLQLWVNAMTQPVLAHIVNSRRHC